MYLSCDFAFSFFAFVISFVSFLSAFFLLKRFRYATINGLFLCLSLYFGGISLNLFQNELFYTDHFTKQNEAKYFLININETVAEKAKSFKLHTKVLASFDSIGNQKKCSGNLVLYISKDSVSKQLKYGDILIIKKSVIKEIQPPQNPDEFDYKRYLRFNNIHFQATLKSDDYYKTYFTKTNPIYSWAYDVQAYFKQTLTTYISSAAETGVAEALLYGYDDEIDPDVMQAYANTGTLHVLAVSGMHVGLIFMLLGILMKFLDKNRKTMILKQVVIIIFLWIYSLLCGLSPSILRATVMFTFIILGQMIKRPTNVYNTLAISAFCLLCTDTNMIANVGFQLSYMAVIGIVFLQPLIYEWYDAKTWLGDQVWKITAVSLAAQLATFPLGLLYFHQFPNYFLFSNLIIIPLTTIVIYIGIVLIIFSKVPLLAAWIGKLMMWGILLTNTIVKYVEQMPYSYVSGIHISIIQTIFIFLLLAFFIAYFLTRINSLFKYGVLAACCFFVLQAAQSFENKTQQELIIYRVPNQTAINFISRDQSVLIIDSTLWADKSKVRFHMQQNFWHRGIANQKLIFTDSAWKKITVNNKQFILTGKENCNLNVSDSTETILIIKNKVKLEKILALVKIKQAIITSSVKPKVANAMKELLQKENIKCNYVGDSGAVELTL